MKKPLSREAIRAIAIRRKIARKNAEAQGNLPGIVTDKPEQAKDMHPRLLAMCVESAGFGQDPYAADAAAA